MYRNCLPGDSPQLMPLDCHLFSDIKEGLARNIALTYWMEKDDPRKYDGSTPQKIYTSICRTIKADCPIQERMVEDIERIKNETLQRIVDAEGTYIEDSTGKGTRHGVRGAAQIEELAKKRKPRIKADPDAIKSFYAMAAQVEKGTRPPPCTFDLTGDSEAVEDNTGCELLEFSRLVEADEVDEE